MSKEFYEIVKVNGNRITIKDVNNNKDTVGVQRVSRIDRPVDLEEFEFIDTGPQMKRARNMIRRSGVGLD